MCPVFNSRTQCHMWVEFALSSRPCTEGFPSGSPVRLILKFNFDRESKGQRFAVRRLLCATLGLNKVDLFILFISILFIIILLLQLLLLSLLFIYLFIYLQTIIYLQLVSYFVVELLAGCYFIGLCGLISK